MNQKSHIAPETTTMADPVGVIERLADQSAQVGYYGLQDANLVLAEAVRELQLDNKEDKELSILVAAWSELIDSYRNKSKIGAEAIINFLRQPELKMQMDDDEFAMLQEQLITEISANESVQPLSDSDNAVVLTQDININSDEFSGPVSRDAQELVGLLLLETEQVRSYLHDIVVGDKESMLNGLQQVEEELERFASVAKIAGFEGLAQVSTHIILNTQRFLEQIDNFTSERHDLLLEWLSQVQEYLPSFNESTAGQLVVAGLTDEQWALPLSFEEMAAILLQIRMESSSVGEQSEAERVEIATDEDVSLALPDDVNQELLDLLLQEMPVQTQQFSDAVQRLQAGGNQNDVELAQRVAHTLKGSANTVGIKGIAVLTHHLEDILIACAREQKLPGTGLANSLINAADCLESMSEALMGISPSPDDAKAVLQEILNWANRIDKEGLADSEFEEVLAETHTASDVMVETVEKAAPEKMQETLVRVPAGQIETLFRVSGESIILNSQAQETARRMRRSAESYAVTVCTITSARRGIGTIDRS